MTDKNTEEITKEFDIVSADTPSEEEVIRIYEPKPKENADDRHTRILDFDDEREPSREDELSSVDGQLMFEGMEPDEEPNVKSVEEQLQDARREKVEKFRLIENDSLRLTGEEPEEETEEPTEEAEEADEEPEEGTVLEDYNSYAETAAVRGELLYRRRGARIGLLVGGFLEFLLLCLMLVAMGGEPFFYLGANLVLLISLMLVAHRVIADGVGAIIHLRFTADTVTALGAFAAAIHTVLQFLAVGTSGGDTVTLYCAVAGFSLVLSLCGRLFRITRICRNFRMVSHKADKYAATFVPEGKQQEQLARYVATVGTPAVAYIKKTAFLTRFMEYSYDDEGHEPLFNWFAPIVILASLLLAMAHMLFGGETANWWNAVGVFTAALCAAAPAFAVAGANLSLCRVARAILRRGAMLIGWRAVETFKNTDALLIDGAELFPSETIRLHGIKTFSGARIDEAILDAAAVSIEAGGSMAGVFRRVIENRTDMLQEVDTLLYEQDMGLSGWVGGRRVLVGNRRLLENHGVDVPSRDYEMRYTKDGRQLVYLSTGGDLCAMFVVSYTADPGIEEALHRLTDAGVTLLLRTTDPNVTSRLVRDVFGVEEESVRILDTAAGRVRDALMLEEDERAEALLAVNGRFEGLGFALSFCRKLHKRIRATGILQMIAGGIGFLMLSASVFVGEMIPPLFMVLNAALWAICTAVAAGFLSEK